MSRMKLFDESFLLSLMKEFRLSMKDLLGDLCHELQHCHPQAATRLRLPVELIRLVGDAMNFESYSEWRVVGWIETLNDLVYFIDLHEQAERNGRDIEFIDQLYADCQQTWYEHGYAEELFPDGAVVDGRLAARIGYLCRRLAGEVARQALLWNPALTCEWIRKTGRRSWGTACDLAANFDRAELPYTVSVGTDGLVYHAPRSVREALRRAASSGCRLMVTSGQIAFVNGTRRVPFYTDAPHPRWHWRRQEPVVLRSNAFGTLTLGPTVVYGRNRVPTRVCHTPPQVAVNMRRALCVIEQAWPVGNRCLSILTSRIIPLKARGVVSFSYRHQPGLSFLNCFDRGRLDLIDDFIHENSHHHLNLLLRKHVLYRNDCNREVFYSPWRRTLRPVRGILHAAFTFTMGAILFERLSTWGGGMEGARRWRGSGLSMNDLKRARFRCAEEIESVRYSLRDLHEAEARFGWITKAGGVLIRLLARALGEVARRMKRKPAFSLRSKYGTELLRHRRALEAVRKRSARIVR
ncbi:MAG TPA: HEXXH motif-containing putative peptide modification protein [Nitrospiraceae bacterium]|nr:HEXXH motif-containing putative peptide modification protein [Nitrospiraceae bacterium]